MVLVMLFGLAAPTWATLIGFGFQASCRRTGSCSTGRPVAVEPPSAPTAPTTPRVAWPAGASSRANGATMTDRAQAAASAAGTAAFVVLNVISMGLASLLASSVQNVIHHPGAALMCALSEV